MSNSPNKDHINIEQFAAFLDGNLSENDMRQLSDVLDGHPAYATLIDDAMCVDEGMRNLTADEAAELEDIMSDNFAIPEITLMPEAVDSVPLYMEDIDIRVAAIGQDSQEVLVESTATQLVEPVDPAAAISLADSHDAQAEMPDETMQDIDINSIEI